MDAINAVGRRKEAIARVFVVNGKGQLIINKKDYKKYLTVETLQQKIELPLKLINAEKQYDVSVNVRGGGIKGQAEAIQLGIARALCKIDPNHKATLKTYRLLTRDARVVERKKFGLKKARKRSQFSKR